MTHLRYAVAAVMVLGLAACEKPAEAPAPTPAEAPATPPPADGPIVTDGPAISIEGEGLRLVLQTGATRALPFGTGKAQTVEILDRLQGSKGEASRNEECGAGPVDFVQWKNGLSALFQDDKFVGWSLGDDGKGLTTMNGIGIGSTRAELTAAFAGVTVEESTLGQEFSAGGMSGILNGPGANATVEALWAGVSCVFR